MPKIKKIHKIIVFFVLIFLLGVYSFTLYISNTIDQKKETIQESKTMSSGESDRQAVQIN